VKIYKIALRIRGENGIWCEIHVRAKNITLAIEKAEKKVSKESGLDLVCFNATETDIEIV
jgi:hypothetical protein